MLIVIIVVVVVVIVTRHIARTSDFVVVVFSFFSFSLSRSYCRATRCAANRFWINFQRYICNERDANDWKMKHLKMHARTHMHSHHVYVISSTFNIYVHAHFAFIGCISLLIFGRSCTNTSQHSLSFSLASRLADNFYAKRTDDVYNIYIGFDCKEAWYDNTKTTAHKQQK